MQYIYNAVVVSVHDGDTLTLDVDLGFYVRVREACRVLGIDAPELSTTLGKQAQAFLANLLPVGTKVTVTSVHADKFGGRFDGIVVMSDGTDITVPLIANGFAQKWDGNGPKPVWPTT